MRILVIGSGGREHALVWKIRQSPLAKAVYCAPGNPGIARIAECVPIANSDLEGLANFAEQKSIDLTVVGPEEPLVRGIVDRFEARGLPIFGPNTDPARIEGSKSFAKELMRSAGIPTAAFWVCDNITTAKQRISEHYSAGKPTGRIVLKADGLAAGKGVMVAEGESQAYTALKAIMDDRVFGAAGDRVVIEEFLEGEELSVMAITDGETIVPLMPAQDHKRLHDGNTGPNTGGMGAYAPLSFLPDTVLQSAMDTVLSPALMAIRELGIPYRGVLYAGLMLTESGIKTIEFNCRFGDPETQTILPLLETDLVPLLTSVSDCSLASVPVRWSSRSSVCVVAASAGYPGPPEIGKEITGIGEAEASESCLVFHSGTARQNEKLVTAGGRVLAVTGLGADLMTATARAYVGMSHIAFDGMTYRKDIAARGLRVA